LDPKTAGGASPYRLAALDAALAAAQGEAVSYPLPNGRTGTVVVARLADLTGADYNPRTLADHQRAAIGRGLEVFGHVGVIVARAEDGLLVGGHQRTGALLADDPEAATPVLFVAGLSDADAKALNVLLNNPNAAGDFDFPKLSALLSDLDGFGYDATVTGFSTAQLETLLTWTPDPAKGAQPDTPDAEQRAADVLTVVHPVMVLCADPDEQKATAHELAARGYRVRVEKPTTEADR
jgi:hypothetical protein